MAETTGLVSFVKVNALPGGDFALCGVMDASTTPATLEVFFVWFTPADRSIATGPEWLQRSLQVSILRDALLSNKTVTVFHGDSSSFINAVQVNA